MVSELEIGLSFAGDMFTTHQIIEYAKIAEKAEFSSIWIAEHYFFRDALNVLGSIAMCTKKIELATGIINPYTRNPVLIAMSLATLNEISGGRAVLGIGTSLPSWIERMGITVGSPLATINESVQIVRRLLRGDVVNHKGRMFEVSDVKLGFSNQNRVPIYLAAVGPKMLRLAGEIGDGVIFTVCNSTDYAKLALSYIERGARKAKRNPLKIDVASILLTAVGKSSDRKLISSVKRLVATFLSRPHRIEIMIGKDSKEAERAFRVKEAMERGDVEGAMKLVNDELIDKVAIVGSLEECITKIEGYMSLTGVTLPIISLVRPTVEKIEKLGELWSSSIR